MKGRFCNRFVWAFVLTALLVCQGNAGQETDMKSRQTVVSGQKQAGEPQFPFPEIPSDLTRPEDRKEFLLKHYWDNFDFSDISLVDNRNISEQGFVNQIALLADGDTDVELVRQSLDNFCSGMEKNIHARRVFMEMAYDYLYSPDSPFYNESLYLIYLKRMAESKVLGEVQREAVIFRIKLISRNLPGDKAADFNYYLSDGTERSLAMTEVKGSHLLLVFYDPECESCHEVLAQMTDDRALAEAVSQEKVSILAVYTEGNAESWQKTLADMPSDWLVGEDRLAIRTDALYDLKSMPSIYLLDKSKRVVLKDTSYEKVREALHLQ